MSKLQKVGDLREVAGRWSLVRYVVGVGGETPTALLGSEASGMMEIAEDWFWAIIVPGVDAIHKSEGLAYSGPCSLQDGILVISPLVTSLRAWLGTVQRRWLTLEGKHLILRAEQASSSFRPDQPSVGIAEWRRI